MTTDDQLANAYKNLSEYDPDLKLRLRRLLTDYYASWHQTVAEAKDDPYWSSHPADKPHEVNLPDIILDLERVLAGNE